MAFLGHEVVHDGEDTLLHFSCILRAEDDELSSFEVQGNTSLILNVRKVLVGIELSSVEDIIISSVSEVFTQFLRGWSDQHVCHEQGMI